MYRIHGVLSLILVTIAFGIGIVATALSSVPFAVISLGLILLAVFCISYIYCSKCLCRQYCNHVILGKISVILREGQAEPYTAFDLLAGVGVPLALAILFPQYWLIKIPYLFVTYWIILLLAGAESLLYVCKSCQNKKCTLCRSK